MVYCPTYEGYKVTAKPTFLPVALERMRDHLKYDGTDNDTHITELITEAANYVEEYTSFLIRQQTIEEKHSSFPNRFVLRFGNVQSITSITYTDEDGNNQTLAATEYKIVDTDFITEIHLTYDKTWPTTQSEASAVTVTYVCGWTSTDDVPGILKRAMRYVAGRWDTMREDDSGKTKVRGFTTAENLMNHYRLWQV